MAGPRPCPGSFRLNVSALRLSLVHWIPTKGDEQRNESMKGCGGGRGGGVGHRNKRSEDAGRGGGVGW